MLLYAHRVNKEVRTDPFKILRPRIMRNGKDRWGYLDRMMLKLPLLTKQAILSSRQPEAILSIASRRELV